MIKKVKSIKRPIWEYLVVLVLTYILGMNHNSFVVWLGGVSKFTKEWIGLLEQSPALLAIAFAFYKYTQTQKAGKKEGE